MKYNKSQIMKNAWCLFRKFDGRLCFGKCLSRAWAQAKEDNEAMARLQNREIDVRVGKSLLTLHRSPIAMCGRMGWYLTGNTYPVRKQIKAFGFEWDVEARCWFTLDVEVAKKVA